MEDYFPEKRKDHLGKNMCLHCAVYRLKDAFIQCAQRPKMFSNRRAGTNSVEVDSK